jgi:23S rRNA (guanosine2251-2'-O)-methyltransferase
VSDARSPRRLRRPTELLLGFNSILAALRHRGEDCLELFVADGLKPSANLEAVLTEAERLRLTVVRTSKAELDRFGERHQGVALERAARSDSEWAVFRPTIPREGPVLLTIIDHVEDPHNLGALMRSAAAFGASAVVVPKNRSAPMNQAARSASAGASEFLPLVKAVNLARTLKDLKQDGFWAVAAEERLGLPLHDFEFPERCALILGGEGRGLSRTAFEAADWLVSIPMIGGSVTSLNVSCAGAVLMHAYAARAESRSRERTVQKRR